MTGALVVDSFDCGILAPCCLKYTKVTISIRITDANFSKIAKESKTKVNNPHRNVDKESRLGEINLHHILCRRLRTEHGYLRHSETRTLERTPYLRTSRILVQTVIFEYIRRHEILKLPYSGTAKGTAFLEPSLLLPDLEGL